MRLESRMAASVSNFCIGQLEYNACGKDKYKPLWEIILLSTSVQACCKQTFYSLTISWLWYIKHGLVDKKRSRQETLDSSFRTCFGLENLRLDKKTLRKNSWTVHITIEQWSKRISLILSQREHSSIYLIAPKIIILVCDLM